VPLLYPGETVRLLREMPEAGLRQDQECEVLRVLYGEDDRPRSVEVKLDTAKGTRTATLPCAAVEPVLSTRTEHRTAVLWGLERPPQEFVTACLHALTDQGLVTAEGLNLVRLSYDGQERWWKRGERIADPEAATVTSAAHMWDGCVLAFAGRESFHLEFRLQGRGKPVVLLHERESAYAEQSRHTAAAMAIARALFALSQAAAAQYCAFPVADAWLMDEDWNSLLRSPYYPDFFLLPDHTERPAFPADFRVTRLAGNRTVAAALPVKFAPHDDPPYPGERELKVNSLRKCHALGEKYYDQMYETRFGTSGLYSSAKDAFLDAIAAAQALGLPEQAKQLEERLANIKNVVRSQFS
jgi:hypothetical protein